MKRDYQDGVQDNAKLFVGVEVERTPAHGLKTLFVTGLQPVDVIEWWYDKEGCSHIFFGANHSFNPIIDDYNSWKEWEDMIYPFLDKGYLCSLDIPFDKVATFHDSGFCERDNFIPQIRVPIPYISLWNYNTMVKIDDKDFKATNPGVWCHSLHSLMDREKFTDWNQYTNDKVIE